jgi:carboxypeptidase PM20D1
LRETYPKVHEALDCEKVGDASLLYKWRGRDASLKPFALLAHMDVVPEEESTLQDWKHPPFGGFADEETIWGRGACDMKNQLVAWFETVELLLKESFTPNCDIYICLGHNEEVQVDEESGARQMAALLEKRGVRLAFVLDEGGAVIDEPPFGHTGPGGYDWHG